jgi:hypothetical protein
MPASIELTRHTLTVHIQGVDRLWALRSQLQTPLVNVISAQAANEEAHTGFHGLRVGGADIPGVLSVGRFTRTASTCSGTCRSPTGRSRSGSATIVSTSW